MKNSILICSLLVAACTCAKLPSTFKKCKKDQPDVNECLSTAVDDAIRQLDKPFKQVGLPSLEPLEIPAVTIEAGTGAVGLQQNFKNVKIYGFTKPESTKFEIDLEKKTAKLEMIVPEIKILAEYDVNGKILLLPVYGEGPGTVIMKNMHGKLTFTFEEYEKKGEKHLKIIEGKLKMQPESVHFNFENLFNGDKALGDNINKVMNENWEEVFSDVKSSYEDAFGQIVTGLFNGLLAKVPISELLE
ncbi:hypothetical protein MTP99_006486 [Tenebrio molitor]|nr:hypothetical protein MTP99_006486 [Tenebrio molitor]